MTDDGDIHSAAAKGYQVAGDAYERGRPEYPADAIACLRRVLEIARGRTVVDVGAGTGKLTRQLVAPGVRVIAVEPVADMRRKFASLLPGVELGVELFEGTAESLPLADASADAIVVAQAFHWFNGAKALREFHRVLKPGGRVALIWNARDESLAWVARLTALIDRHEAGAPRYRTGRWREAFAGSTLFDALTEERFSHAHKGDVDTVVDRVTSISFIAALAPEEKATVAREVRELLAGREEIALPYLTSLFWCTRREPAASPLAGVEFPC